MFRVFTLRPVPSSLQTMLVHRTHPFLVMRMSGAIHMRTAARNQDKTHDSSSSCVVTLII